MNVEESKLTAAVQSKVEAVTVAGKELRLYKWTWRQSLAHGKKFLSAAQALIKNRPAVDLMKEDFGKIILEHADLVVDILADSIIRDNFENKGQAKDWLEELALDEMVELLTVVVKQNYVPLKQAFSALKSAVSGNNHSTATK